MNVPVGGRLAPGTRLTADTGRDLTVCSWRGEGSYARVYRAEYGPGGGPCAVKVAKPEVPEAEARLRHEGRVLAELRHPRVVALLDTGRHGSALLLVLEWLEGDTLLDLVASRRRLPLRQSLEILEAVCEGLAALHQRGQVHGDLRPQNVILTPDRGAVLTDPGAAIDAAVPASVEGDIRAAGSLFHHLLTGADPQHGGPRLAPGAGYNRSAVHLWETTAAAAPPGAAALLTEVRRLRTSL